MGSLSALWGDQGHLSVHRQRARVRRVQLRAGGKLESGASMDEELSSLRRAPSRAGRPLVESGSVVEVGISADACRISSRHSCPLRAFGRR